MDVCAGAPWGWSAGRGLQRRLQERGDGRPASSGSSEKSQPLLGRQISPPAGTRGLGRREGAQRGWAERLRGAPRSGALSGGSRPGRWGRYGAGPARRLRGARGARARPAGAWPPRRGRGHKGGGVAYRMGVACRAPPLRLRGAPAEAGLSL